MPATLAQALAQARTRIAALDAQMLLLHVLGRPVHERAWLLAHDRDALDPAAAACYAARVERRAAGEPLAYLIGEREFFGLRLQLDARVLDPRPDTETLVYWALERLSACPASSACLRVLDLGTGSGAIALALAHAGRDAGGRAVEVTAVDASADALDVAAANAQRLRLPLRLLHGDWFAPLAPGERFALILSNPPYIAEGDAHLGALRHEPKMALTSGADGLEALRHIVRGANAHLQPGGWLLLEHGWDQAQAVRELLQAAGFAQVQSRHDLAGHVRCSGGCWPGA